MVSMQHAGLLAQAKEDWGTALCHYLEAASMARALVAQTGADATLSELADVLVLLGTAQSALGRLPEARAVFSEGVSIRRQVAVGDTAAAARRELLRSLQALAVLEAMCGQPDAAEAIHRECLPLARGLASERRTMQARSDLAGVLSNLAAVLQKQGRAEDAVGFMSESLGLVRELAAQRGNPGSLREVTHALHRMESMLEDVDRLEEANAVLSERLRLYREEAEVLGPQIRRIRELSLLEAGEKARARGQWSECMARFQEHLELRRVSCAGSTAPESIEGLAAVLEMLGDVARQAGDICQAREAYRECLSIRRTLPVGAPAARAELARVLAQAGEIELNDLAWNAAEVLGEEALALERELALENPGQNSEFRLSWALVRVAAIRHAQGRSQEAAALCQESLAIARGLERDSATGAKPLLAQVLFYAVESDMERGELGSAEIHCRERVRIVRQEFAESGGGTDERNLAVGLSQLAVVVAACGNATEADQLMREALSLTETHAAKVGSQSSQDLMQAMLWLLEDLSALSQDTEGTTRSAQDPPRCERRVNRARPVRD